MNSALSFVLLKKNQPFEACIVLFVVVQEENFKIALFLDSRHGSGPVF